MRMREVKLTPFSLKSVTDKLLNLARKPLRLFARTPLLLSLSLIGLIPSIAHAVYTTPGQFSVGAGGNASYSIPIQVPPGTAGLAPKLSLNYTSGGGNGILGLGWGIDGLSQIGRCGQTIIQDGTNRGINYDSNDKYCIDGQRLISTGGTYGADSTEYRTEQANFARIISYGTAGNGPASFKVWTKGGQVIEYGNTADSRIEGAGIATVRTYGVNKISDTKGNYITISYVEDNANGEAYVSRIDYTGNASTTPVLTPYASVQFSYVTRPDITTTYVAGYVNKTQHRMTNVKTYLGNTLVKDYRLSYANTGTYHLNASNVADGSVLTQLQECDGSATSTCKNPTSLTWTIGSNPTTAFGTSQAWPGLPAGATVVATGDINGDGRADVIYDVWTAPTSGGGTSYGALYFAFSNGSSFTGTTSTGLVGGAHTCVATNTFGQCISSIYTRPSAVLGDVNGDGKADLVTASGIYLSTGSGFGALQSAPTGYVIAVADINGDGRADVIYDVVPASGTGTLYFAFSSGSGFTGVTSTGLVGGTYGCILAGIINSTCQAWIYTRPSAALGDVNGDGKADLVTASGIYLSTGSGFGALQSAPTGYVIAVADINGDGRADVIYDVVPASGTGTGTLYFAFSNGSAFTGAVNTSLVGGTYGCILAGIINSTCQVWGYSPPSFPLADLNGDGLLDMLSDGTAILAVSNVPDQITTINNGYGATQTISYSPLSNSATYTMDSGASAGVFPTRDVLPAVPMYVVSSVASSDGIGGNLVTNYSYGGLKLHLTGRGSLGFRWIKTSTPDADTYLTNFYRQDYPYIGMPSQSEKHLISTGAILSVAQVTYANSPITTGSAVSQFPYLSQSVEQNYDLNGGFLLGTTTTTNQYDSYGNVTRVTVDDGAGSVKTTTNTYNNDTSHWYLGRLVRASVSSTSPTTSISTPPVALSLTVNPSSLVVNGTAPGTVSGTASLFAAGGIAPYTYRWSKVSGTVISVSGTQTGTFTGTLSTAGANVTEVFKGSVTDAAGNTATANLNVKFTTPAAYIFNTTIVANTTNYNLKSAAIAAGWNQVLPLQATVTVNAGVIIGSTSTGAYAFDTGVTFPAGTTLTLVNNGKILGAGGAGGNGGYFYISTCQNPTAGRPGGPAFRAQQAIRVTNNGIIGGGGGGGAGSIAGNCGPYSSGTGNGGGGGQGFTGGAGGAKGDSGSLYGNTASAGTAGTPTAPGLPGGFTLGGGACTSGNGNISWIVLGSRYGALN